MTSPKSSQHSWFYYRHFATSSLKVLAVTVRWLCEKYCFYLILNTLTSGRKKKNKKTRQTSKLHHGSKSKVTSTSYNDFYWCYFAPWLVVLNSSAWQVCNAPPWEELLWLVIKGCHWILKEAVLNGWSNISQASYPQQPVWQQPLAAAFIVFFLVSGDSRMHDCSWHTHSVSSFSDVLNKGRV